jgi:nucleotide-binding universal stress UspA family protein
LEERARHSLNAPVDPTERIELLLRDLRTRRDGLSSREAARRLIASGPNELRRHTRRPARGDFQGRVLFASDGSPGSDLAAALAGRIGLLSGSDVALVRASDGGTPTMRSQLRQQRMQLMEATGREPDVSEASGSPHEQIIRCARELGAGLIVIGSRGLGGVKALGSVSERVAHQAPCSVLVARPSP